MGAAAGGAAVAVGGLELVVLADGATFVVGAVTAALMSDRANRAPTTAHAGDDGEDDEGDEEGEDGQDGEAGQDGEDGGGDRDGVGDDETGVASGVASGEEAADGTSIRAGLRVLRGRPEVAALVWIQGLAMFGFGAFPVLFIVFVTDTLGQGEAEVGLIRASSAFGGLLAAAFIGSIASRMHPARLMTWGYFLFAAVAFAFMNAPEFTTAVAVYVVLFAASGFPNVATQVGSRSTAQVLCPPAVLGRLGGLLTAATSFGMGAGSILAGALIGTLGARTLFNGQVVVLLLCGVIAWLRVLRPVRSVGV